MQLGQNRWIHSKNVNWNTLKSLRSIICYKSVLELLRHQSTTIKQHHAIHVSEMSGLAKNLAYDFLKIDGGPILLMFIDYKM